MACQSRLARRPRPRNVSWQRSPTNVYPARSWVNVSPTPSKDRGAGSKRIVTPLVTGQWFPSPWLASLRA